MRTQIDGTTRLLRAATLGPNKWELARAARSAHVDALKAHIGDVIASAKPWSNNSATRFLRERKAKALQEIRDLFRERYGSPPNDYYYSRLAEQVRAIRAQKPCLSVGWLAAKTGATERAILRALRIVEGQQAAA